MAIHDPPANSPELTDDEIERWNQWTKATVNWRTSDLRLLVRLVKAEIFAEKLRLESENTVATLETATGALKSHLVHAESRHAEKVVLDYVRALGLNTRPSTDTAASDFGLPVQQSQYQGRGRRSGGDKIASLIARPSYDEDDQLA